MATRVDQMYSAKDREVFRSVFPASTKQPQTKQRAREEIQRVTEKVTQQFQLDSKTVLGIRDEQYRLPPGDSRSFKPHFASCPSLTIVAQPTPQQRTQLILNMLNTPAIEKGFHRELDEGRIKSVLAQVVNKSISDFVSWSYSGVYNEEVRNHLSFWIEHVLATWVATVLYCVDSTTGIYKAIEVSLPTTAYLEQFRALAFSQLWTLRVDELFDIIVDWDDTVAGIDDIKTLLTTPQARQYVAQKLTTTLHARLLHPGASTVEILQIYISIIRAFRRLDVRGVILSKISGRVRQYLRERDDTVKVVVAGLLSDVPTSLAKTEGQVDHVLNELAWELQNRDASTTKSANNSDWNNMNWQPDPIDAVSDQMKSTKHLDVIGSIISLFESKDIFVKELQVTLAERLLKNREDYDQETAVIEHLKIRFGDAALQACEVMLRDVTDSKRLDQVIRRDQGLLVEGTKTDNQEPELHAKILSRLFWPTLPGSAPSYGNDSDEEQTFKPPLSILHQRNLYEEGFENLKQTRKLTWNDNLGEVEIELDFADGRTYHDRVLPYQAGVIYAFNNDSSDDESSEPITKTVDDLSNELNLPANLVRSACLLFVSKRVLVSSTHIHDAFTVLEHLPPAPGTATGAIDVNTNAQTAPTHVNADIATSSASAAAAQAAADRAAELAAQQAQKEAEAREKRAKMAVYQQFITAMLTNQGSMPLPRIAMMLGMVVPGGFPFSNEELREFLGSMVRDGVVTLQGNNYKKA